MDIIGPIQWQNRGTIFDKYSLNNFLINFLDENIINIIYNIYWLYIYILLTIYIYIYSQNIILYVNQNYHSVYKILFLPNYR